MKLIKLAIISVATIFFVSSSYGQTIGRGDPTARKIGIHRGNQVRTVFDNWGVIAQPGDQGPRGAWKFDANGYVGDVSPLVGVLLPVRDYNNDSLITKADTIHSVIITPVSRPGGGDFAPGGGQSWTFEPISGFANPTLDEKGKGVAMSHLPETWPDFWPDHPDWVDSSGKAEWNGFFGRNQFNADQESYFWMDDNRDEKMFVRHGFLPDSTDPSRKGQALQVKVRGLQWANFLAQDVIFWLYEIKNVGTVRYDQTVFGTLVGTYVGAEGDEWNDDVSFFAVRDAITYSWDFDHYIRPSANPRWKPNPSAVGYIAYAFLESPGNPFDGIDNDGDDRDFQNTAPYFQDTDFDKRTINAGDKLVLIDDSNDDGNFIRKTITMPNSDTTVFSMGRQFDLSPGVTELEEGNLTKGTNLNPNAFDGIDNDLDGIIDENFQVHYRQFKKDETTEQVLIDTLDPVQYKDFVNNVGLNDLMVDESRNDGIDNDDDWSRDPDTGELLFNDNGNLIDDVGADGKPNTHDMGEGDGVPTLGEPNFDQTDVDESDQIGLTSFQYFVPAGSITMSDEEDMWQRLNPGHFDVPSSIQNNVAIRGEDGDFIYGSGYFPLLPGNTQRFSLALAFGDDFPGVLKTKRIAQLIYNANYNFPRPPDKPTLTAVPGDGKVTLYWDKVAEKSIDPTTKEKDFEGYKIYKGTDPDFVDAFTISDGTGRPRQYKPFEQFDLKDGVTGFFSASSNLINLTSGVPFFLGDDTGIQNSFEDTDVENGRTYYYAVVAYDKGKSISDIFPTENTKFIAINIDGKVQLDINTAAVVPTAPVAGYVPPKSGEKTVRETGYSEVTPIFDVIDPGRVTNSTYEVSFEDSLVQGIPIAYAYNVKNLSTNEILISNNPHLVAKDGAVFEGVYLSIDNRYQNLDSVKVNTVRSGWNNNNADNLRFTIQPFDFPNLPKGIKDPKDYEFVFYDSYDKPTSDVMPGIPTTSINTNFEIYDVTDPNNSKQIPFRFLSKDDTLNSKDNLILATPDTSKLTWFISFSGDSVRIPKAGDSLLISINKPLNSGDKFKFTTVGSSFDANKAKVEIKNVKVVPNPYVVTNVFEQPLPTQIRGRGERVVNFINLPPNSRIDIYTSSGVHVKTINQEGSLENGTVSWDLRSSEGLDVAYGVYFYVVQAKGVSEKKFGKIGIIK